MEACGFFIPGCGYAFPSARIVMEVFALTQLVIELTFVVVVAVVFAMVLLSEA